MKWIAVPSVRNYLTKRCPEMVKLQGFTFVLLRGDPFIFPVIFYRIFSYIFSIIDPNGSVFMRCNTLLSRCFCFYNSKNREKNEYNSSSNAFHVGCQLQCRFCLWNRPFLIRQSGSKFQLLVELSFLKCNCLSGKVSNYLWGLQQISSLKWVLKT